MHIVVVLHVPEQPFAVVHVAVSAHADAGPQNVVV
jgi:hypothetical protein